ncbi:hypothetical protein SARC_13668 [Sphaeroforma arctica JP610]|uniref:TLDc domain-containing protein n=1 Tax=Sphaeroforma arctica JP610 TaxID=667725 RepID=A0A0L0FB97_9EUKA|nr:hypothetical protein SARC_13668 [Sphaeroforma arctica JP610]KNC73776.1 hypothetical protein SARC_13668 [Sphaeroforma arctica JP610]|eukprot:XP_014147678.1 hypothetical protein SARC_13668 [Sphaeroforma arctica JP610]
MVSDMFFIQHGVCSDGVPALWLSEDLLHGSSDNTETFNNAILSSSKDFQCMGLEVWGFA